MTDKELRKLSRKELLEILISQELELQRLRKKLDDAEIALQDREIAIGTAGSIAEAALQLNNVFEAADKAAKQYLENVRRMSEEEFHGL